MKKKKLGDHDVSSGSCYGNVTDARSQNGEKQTAKRKMQVEVKMGLLLMG